MTFCRFGEWNGEEAMGRRGDSARARKSRTRSRARMGRAASVTPVTENAPETVPKLVSKAHESRDARHTLRAPSIDVDVDVLKDNCFKKTTTSTLEPVAAEEAFAMIRRALASAYDADDAQVAKDRQTAWKAAVVIADRLGRGFIEQVLQSAGRAKPRRPYAYLWSAIERKLQREDEDAKRLFSMVVVPADLVDPEDALLRVERVIHAKKKPISSVPLDEQRAACRAELADKPSASKLYEEARKKLGQPVPTAS